MNDTRPVNLDLTTISLPVTAFASILHRVSAVIIWVGLAALLAILSCALSSEDSYNEMAQLLTENFLVKFCVWGFLTAFGYYCMGTIKHIIQDFGYFEDLAGGKLISSVAIGLGIVLSIIAGVAVWA